MDLTEHAKPNKHILLADNFSLLLKLAPSQFKKNYGYILTFKNGEQENSIKYEVAITYIKTIPDVARLFRIERISKVYVNDTEPDLLIDKLANEAASALYPMIVEVDFNGKFLALNNYQEIADRWKTARAKIKEYFTGDISEQYCVLMEKTIASADLLRWKIQQDFLISTFFAPIYKSYTSALKIEDDTTFPIAGSAMPVLFKVTQQVKEYLNELDAVELQHGGIAIDSRSAADIENEHSFAFEKSTNPDAGEFHGEYTARYLLHAQSKAIRSINAQWILDLSRKRTITISMHQIISDTDNTSADTDQQQGSSLVFIDREEKSEGIFSGIWKSLFG